MSRLTENERQACNQARNFAEEYSFIFAKAISEGTKPTEAHVIAVRLATIEYPMVD